MTHTSSKLYRSALAVGAASLMGFASVASAQDCGALAGQMASAAQSDPEGAPALAGASIAGNCECAAAVMQAMAAAFGADSPQIPATVFYLVEACPDQGASIAEVAVAAAPGQEAAIRDAATRGGEAGLTGGDGFDYGLKPLETAGVYLIPPSASSSEVLSPTGGDATPTVVVRTVRGGTRTVVVGGGTGTTPVTTPGVGG